MTKYPVVLILSEGNVSPKEIISNIRKTSMEENVETLNVNSSCSLTGYIYNLTTKYYTSDLYLVPFEEDISLAPAELTESVEGVLIYFDSGKRGFSNRIPKYAEFLKDNGIEMGILLCDRLYDDSNEGITYKEAKQESKVLDVIELGRTREEDEEEDPHDPLGYDELHQTLKSFIWSNVNLSSVKPVSLSHLTSPDNSESSVSAATSIGDGNAENAIETELELFEKLLAEVMTFKNQTASWSRNEKLAYAEKFADKFDKMLSDIPNSSDEEN